MKKYVIYAGVNGAGKSTLYYADSHEDFYRINTDEIVRKMGKWEDVDLQMRAGIIAVRKIREYFDNGVSFNQETTLCGHAIMNNIQKAKALGYCIEMHYIGLKDVELAKKRVKDRVKKGGHGIQDSLIEKRYSMSLDNLNKAIPLCDKVVIYDNSVSFVKIAEFETGNIIWINEEVEADWFINNVLNKFEKGCDTKREDNQRKFPELKKR